jgi:hypothetical protein
MYFQNFPYVEYDFPDGKTRFIKDITIRPNISAEVFGSASNLQEYVVVEGETPETIAYDFYGDAKLHWIIMLANNISSVYSDWPLSTQELSDYLADKYAVQNDSDGNTVTLSGDDLNEFLEFTGSPSNNYQSRNSLNVVMKPLHFEDADGDVYSYDTVVDGSNIDAFGRSIVLPEVTPVSIYQYEEKLNEAKRIIYVPKKSIADKMRTELGGVVNV